MPLDRLNRLCGLPLASLPLTATPSAKQATTFCHWRREACSLHASAAGSAPDGRAAACRPREAPPGNWRDFSFWVQSQLSGLLKRAQLFRDLAVAAENYWLPEFTDRGVTKTCDGKGASPSSRPWRRPCTWLRSPTALHGAVRLSPCRSRRDREVRQQNTHYLTSGSPSVCRPLEPQESSGARIGPRPLRRPTLPSRSPDRRPKWKLLALPPGLTAILGGPKIAAVKRVAFFAAS